jgi:hypothetical protein
MASPFARTAWALTGALLVWAADFLFVYAFAAIACARGHAAWTVLGIGVVPFAAAAANALAATATGAIVWWALRTRRTPNRMQVWTAHAALVGAILGGIAIAMIALPGFMVRGICV